MDTDDICHPCLSVTPGSIHCRPGVATEEIWNTHFCGIITSRHGGTTPRIKGLRHDRITGPSGGHGGTTPSVKGGRYARIVAPSVKGGRHARITSPRGVRIAVPRIVHLSMSLINLVGGTN